MQKETSIADVLLLGYMLCDVEILTCSDGGSLSSVTVLPDP